MLPVSTAYAAFAAIERIRRDVCNIAFVFYFSDNAPANNVSAQAWELAFQDDTGATVLTKTGTDVLVTLPNRIQITLSTADKSLLARSKYTYTLFNVTNARTEVAGSFSWQKGRPSPQGVFTPADLKVVYNVVTGSVSIGGLIYTGIQGSQGWSPVLGLVPGTPLGGKPTLVLKVTGFAGGQGTPPPMPPAGTSWYVAFNGTYTTDINSAVDIRGTNGLDGANWRTGQDVPNGGNQTNRLDGVPDLFLHLPTGDVYGQLGSGTWLLRGNIRGVAGLNAWEPIIAAVADGQRVVHQVVDWFGGEGAKPVAGQFLGPAGFVATAALATNIRGFGAWEPIIAAVADGVRVVHQVVDWFGGEGPKPAVGQFLGPTGFVATAALATDMRGPQGLKGDPGTMLANAFPVVGDIDPATAKIGLQDGTTLQKADFPNVTLLPPNGYNTNINNINNLIPFLLNSWRDIIQARPLVKMEKWNPATSVWDDAPLLIPQWKKLLRGRPTERGNLFMLPGERYRMTVNTVGASNSSLLRFSVDHSTIPISATISVDNSSDQANWTACGSINVPALTQTTYYKNILSPTLAFVRFTVEVAPDANTSKSFALTALSLMGGTVTNNRSASYMGLPFTWDEEGKMTIGNQVNVFDPPPCAVLDLNTTTAALLLSRLTQAQRNAIPTPESGLITYQNDADVGFWGYEGGVWKRFVTVDPAAPVIVGGMNYTLQPGDTPSTQYLPILTLPATNAGTMDAAMIVAMVGSWTLPRQTIRLQVGQRDQFWYSWTSEGPAASGCSIQAYRNANNTTTVYVKIDNTFQTCNVHVPLYLRTQVQVNTALVKLPGVAPGTLIFDTANPTLYPVAPTIIRQYTPTGTNDPFGVVGMRTRDDLYDYQKTSVGWKRSPLYTTF